MGPTPGHHHQHHDKSTFVTESLHFQCFPLNTFDLQINSKLSLISIDLQHTFNSKLAWLCYWILTLSMLRWTSFYLQINSKLTLISIDVQHTLNSKLAWLCYWILTPSMFWWTSFYIQINSKLSLISIDLQHTWNYTIA